MIGKHKKASNMTIELIIGIVLLLIVLAVLIFIFSKNISRQDGFLGDQNDKVKQCAENPAACGYFNEEPQSPPSESSTQFPKVNHGLPMFR